MAPLPEYLHPMRRQSYDPLITPESKGGEAMAEMLALIATSDLALASWPRHTSAAEA